MDSSKTVSLMVFHSLPQANVIKGLLEANGIQCFISNTETTILNPLFDNTNDTIRLYVLEKDLDTAREILIGDLDTDVEGL